MTLLVRPYSLFFQLAILCLLSLGCKEQAQSQFTQEASSAESILHYEILHPVQGVEPKGLLILLHGRGSNEQDLTRFVRNIRQDLIIVSPRGPITMGENRYAWYQMSRENGVLDYEEQDVLDSTDDIVKFTLLIQQQESITDLPVWVAGFSQGGVMALGTGLNHPEIFDRVLCWSGQLYPEHLNTLKFPKKQTQEIYISHGNQDNVLAAKEVKSNVQQLEQLGYRLDARYFESGHTISQENYIDIVEWMRSH